MSSKSESGPPAAVLIMFDNVCGERLVRGRAPEDPDEEAPSMSGGTAEVD